MTETKFKDAVAAVAAAPALITAGDVRRARFSIIQDAIARATRARVLTAAAPKREHDRGARFVIPLLLPEGVESGDSRTFSEESLSMRDLPLPLMWQIRTRDGHDDSVVVGTIERMERVKGGIGNASGYFDTGEYGREAERMVRNGMLRFISADLDRFEASEDRTAALSADEIKAIPLNVKKGRIMAATIVAKPAYQECKIMIVNDKPISFADRFPDGEYTQAEDAALVASVAAAETKLSIAPDSLVDVPVFPPADWFTDPKLTAPTALTVDSNGRVFGHIASWDQDHIGMPAGTRTPHSLSNYAYFHTGALECADGSRVSVGQITLSGGHAPLTADAAAAVKHYDDTESAMVDVRAGEDAYGIWVAGAVRPGVTQAQLRAFKASAPSGDWRGVRPGQLELVAVCQVNVPGFPVVRAVVASGAVTTLVAAGVSTLANELTISASASEKIARLAAARDAKFAANAAAAIARIDARSGLSAYRDAFAALSAEDKHNLARRRIELADGSYPIRNATELQHAITESGRNPGNVALRCHVVRRARALQAADTLPAWPEANLSAGKLFQLAASASH